MRKILLLLIACSSVTMGQNISASRMPMGFGSNRQAIIQRRVLQGLQQEIESADSVRYAKMVCPLCGGQMAQIYSDTVTVASSRKAVRILRCSNGNKVLLTYTVPQESPFQWIRNSAKIKPKAR